MSFGFSVGDFVAVLNLVKGISDACQNGPKEYRELCREVKSLGAVTSQLSEDMRDPDSLLNRKGVARRKDLLQIMENCEEALREVGAFVEKHSVLDAECNYHSSKDVAKRTWHNYKVGAENLDNVRGKLTFYTSTITLFMNSLETSALGRIESKLDKLYAKLILEDKRNSTTSLASTTSLMSFIEQDEPDEEAWNDLRNKLVDEGVSAADIELYRDCIVEYLKALIIDNLPSLNGIQDMKPPPSHLEPDQGPVETNFDIGLITFGEPIFGTFGSSSACLMTIDLEVLPRSIAAHDLRRLFGNIQLVLSNQTLNSEPDLFFWNSAFPRFLKWYPHFLTFGNIGIIERASYRPRHNDISYEEYSALRRSGTATITNHRLEVDRGILWNILGLSPDLSSPLHNQKARLVVIVANGTKPFRIDARLFARLGQEIYANANDHIEITPRKGYLKLDQIDLANVWSGLYEELVS